MNNNNDYFEYKIQPGDTFSGILATMLVTKWVVTSTKEPNSLY